MRMRTCFGCSLQEAQCDHRDAMKLALQGLGVTSIKWRCRNRVPQFIVGSRVWAVTDVSLTDYFDDRLVDDFPGTVVKILDHAKALVFIPKGALGRTSGAEFEPSSNGFCKLPFSRMTLREDLEDTVCPACLLPEQYGHLPNHSCSFNFEARGLHD